MIKFLSIEGNNAKEIHVGVYGQDAPHYATVARWVAEFKHGRQSVADDPRSGRPPDAVNSQTIAHVETLVLKDRRIRVKEIAAELHLSHGSVLSILHDHLAMSKVCARWVPRNLGTQERNQRVESSRELLDIYNADAEDFRARLVTGDETWLHYWDPESKQESKQWVQRGSSPPKKFRTQPSAGKIMASIFWDASGVLLMECLPRGATVTGEYYSNLLRKLRQAIKEKRRGKLSKGVLLLHDNAPVHKARIAQATLRDCGFEQLNHPHYSPDLVPSDYYLFRLLKSHLRGTRFSSDDELTHAAESWLNEQSADFYFCGIDSLKEKWNKCILVKGEYIEK